LSDEADGAVFARHERIRPSFPQRVENMWRSGRRDGLICGNHCLSDAFPSPYAARKTQCFQLILINLHRHICVSAPRAAHYKGSSKSRASAPPLSAIPKGAKPMPFLTGGVEASFWAKFTRYPGPVVPATPIRKDPALPIIRSETLPLPGACPSHRRSSRGRVPRCAPVSTF